MRRFVLVVIAVTLLSGSIAQAASYEKTDGTIVELIDWLDLSSHPYSGPNLEPGVAVSFANLYYANLTNANLTNANLYYANLAYANLTNANLDYANLRYADLDYANLWQADLYYANLTNADLRYADLTDADLTDADLYYANLTNANLRYADLRNADLRNANLEHANLTNADLTYADLDYANLTNADLTNADLRYADLTDATLTYAYLTYAELGGANLTHANLHAATLTGADLTNANLYYANLTNANLYGANLADAAYVDTAIGSPYYYANTTLPAWQVSGFDPAEKGWTLSPYCDFTPDAACDLADINQMFETGDLVTGVAVAGPTDRLDLVDNDTINTADITEWLSQAATFNGHSSPYLRGDTDLDRNVDLADYSELANNFDPTGNLGPHGWDHGNADGDNDVDLADYNELASNFSPAGYGDAAVPEPSSLVLVVAGLLAAAGPGCWRH